ncbi:MAG: hypothetical protein RIQ71_1464 [Verrucomicrobiota bacterium]|jgi:hypothetical protein
MNTRSLLVRLVALPIITITLALGFAAAPLANAAVAVDGVKEADYGAPIAVQSVTAGWGANNTLASLSAVQQGASLYVFLAGRPQGNAFMLFVDCKPGGVSSIPNNLISSGGEEYCINNFGSSSTAGMTFETGFQPDYAIRVFGDGSGSTGAYTAVYPLTPGASRSYIGDSGGTTGASGAPVTLLRSVWQNVTGAYADATQGSEMQLNIAQLGVPTGSGQTIKFMAMLVNGGSDYGSNQVLGSLPGGSGDLGGGMKTTDFNTVTGTQTLSVTVNNADADGDGIPDADDPDDDNDGLLDTVETNTGIFVDASNTGSNPVNPDTDGDGMNDFNEVAAGRNPNKYDYSVITVAGAFQGWSPTPTPTNAPVNVMSNVSAGGTGFDYELLWRFSAVTTTPGKFTAGSWSVNWGASTNAGVANRGGGDIQFPVTASGIWKFAFNTDTLAYSFTRQAAPATYAAWAAQYGLAADSGATDDDGDGLVNSAEFAANTDPLNLDTDGDGLYDSEELSGDYSAVVPSATGAFATVPSVLNKPLNPLTRDSDGDGLNDLWELSYGLDPTDNGTVVSYLNATGLSVTSNPNGATSNPDGDTADNLAEQTAGTSPLTAGTGFVSAYPKITVPGSFTGWNVAGSGVNTMQLTGNFTWKLIFYFASAPVDPQYKFAAGSWSTSWGDTQPANGVADLGSGDNISGAAVFTAPGYYLITFNDSTLAYSATTLPVGDSDADGLPDAYEVYYGAYLSPALIDLNPATDYNSDGKTTLQNYQDGTHPTLDATPPVIALAPAVQNLTWAAVGATVTLANSDVTATDNITTNPVISINPATLDTSVAGTTVVSYTATDDAGNQSTVGRTIVVGDAAPGWYSLWSPASASITTAQTADIYGQIYVDGATGAAGAAPNIQAWVGVSSTNTDPSTWGAAAWSAATFNTTQFGANDEYKATLSGATLGAGTYYYAYRWQIGSGAYFYGGIKSDGSGRGPWDGTTNVNGTLTVSAVSSYDSWASQNGLSGASAQPTADPDSDGYTNQQEYAFGGNPNAGNAALVKTSVSGGYMVVTWFQRTDAAAGAYKVKTTTSLATPFAVNNTLTAAVVPSSATAPNGYESKQVSVAITGERNFLALAFD